MIKALYTAGTGMEAQQIAVDVIANNLANVNTTGFKRSAVNFKDLLYVTLEEPGSSSTNNTVSPSGSQVGTGTEVESISKIFTQGAPEPTGRSLDLAIQGDGFFQVTLPSGETGYTRNGAFQLDATGKLVTGDGFALTPAVTIGANALSITVGQDGTVSTIDDTGTASTAGAIQIAKFLNPAGLSSEGDNIYKKTVSSGEPSAVTPGTSGSGLIRQATLERSNVEVVNEMVGLIVAQRAYEFSSKAIQSTDQMLQQVNAIAG